MSVRTMALTAMALVAFAANSILCRLALRGMTIDAATFATIRFSAGAATLVLIATATRRTPLGGAGSWTSAIILLLYAVPFSFAYVALTTGTGALILFGSVQVTMMMVAWWRGERPLAIQWAGMGLAMLGLVYLVLPGLAAPPPYGAAAMALAGACWGAYSLRGRATTDPLRETAGNFVRSVPLLVLVSVLARSTFYVEPKGAMLAVVSGALASGVGYVVWYGALRGLTATRAAVVQLAVPILATAGGVMLLGEAVSLRLLVSTVAVLGGVLLALRPQSVAPPAPQP